MLRRSLLRAARLPLCRPPHATRHGLQSRSPHFRQYSQAQQTRQQRIAVRLDRFVDRTPRFARPWVSTLRGAPISVVVAFFVLHEITAVAPLVGLTWCFHYYRWLPESFSEHAIIDDSVNKMARWLRKKELIKERNEEEEKQGTEQGKNRWSDKSRKMVEGMVQGAEDKQRLLVEVATAYAVVKVLLPFRIVLSAWAAPWSARWVLIPVSTYVVMPVGRGIATAGKSIGSFIRDFLHF
jgi:hypothetical protein